MINLWWISINTHRPKLFSFGTKQTAAGVPPYLITFLNWTTASPGYVGKTCDLALADTMTSRLPWLAWGSRYLSCLVVLIWPTPTSLSSSQSNKRHSKSYDQGRSAWRWSRSASSSNRLYCSWKNSIAIDLDSICVRGPRPWDVCAGTVGDTMNCSPRDKKNALVMGSSLDSSVSLRTSAVDTRRARCSWQ